MFKSLCPSSIYHMISSGNVFKHSNDRLHSDITSWKRLLEMLSHLFAGSFFVYHYLMTWYYTTIWVGKGISCYLGFFKCSNRSIFCAAYGFNFASRYSDWWYESSCSSVYGPIHLIYQPKTHCSNSLYQIFEFYFILIWPW